MADSYVPHLPHRIVAALDNGDLHAATDLARPVASGHEHAWRRLNFELAALAAPRPGIVMVGLSVLVWGNPYRGGGHSWRCGSCPRTGVDYTSGQAALRAARDHIAKHPAAGRPELCQITPYDSLHARMTALLPAA
jgi:hypothetical protein